MAQVYQLRLNDSLVLNYELRTSRRSRYLRMQISTQGLIVTKPWGLSLSAVEAWLVSKATWISKHWPQTETQLEKPPFTLPQTIELKALDQHISIYYETASLARLQLQFNSEQQHLTLRGEIAQIENCHNLLKVWLRQYAQLHLPNKLKALAEETGFSYTRCVLKNQKSRWGSCSSQGIINLNAKLLLLPEAWVRYVLIHELCHTRELNHSANFWSLVAQFEPDYQTIHRAMRDAMHLLPTWAK